jgi:hypothetical protein
MISDAKDKIMSIELETLILALDLIASTTDFRGNLNKFDFYSSNRYYSLITLRSCFL